jgi:D-serine dehydratase
VGSTGNLGLSIGIMAAALGFNTIVHMSSDAKEWKKARLRKRGVEVVEHTGDFGAAVAAGRSDAMKSERAYFVDDENSPDLFLGYSVAALRLARQLNEAGVVVDEAHPLFVYVPCGVGGAPGGISFGLRQLFGDSVHVFFAEPVASPCMLVRLALGGGKPLSVRDIGLDNKTEADGLAVAQCSEFIAEIITPIVSGIFTVPDEQLLSDLYVLNATEELKVEPSATAGFQGPNWLLRSDVGRQYLEAHHISRPEKSTHVLWTTGGSFVPDEEFQKFYERGREEYLLKASLR